MENYIQLVSHCELPQKQPTEEDQLVQFVSLTFHSVPCLSLAIGIGIGIAIGIGIHTDTLRLSS